MHCSLYVEIRGQLPETIFSVCHAGSGNQTQIIIPEAKCLYLLAILPVLK